MSGTLTKAQTIAIADNCKKYADIIEDYREKKHEDGKLTQEENRDLKKLVKDLLDAAKRLYVASTIDINEVKQSLEKLDKITKNIQETYENLRKVQKAIDIGAAALGFIKALLANDLNGIDSSLDTFFSFFPDKRKVTAKKK